MKLYLIIDLVIERVGSANLSRSMSTKAIGSKFFNAYNELKNNASTVLDARRRRKTFVQLGVNYICFVLGFFICIKKYTILRYK